LVACGWGDFDLEFGGFLEFGGIGEDLAGLVAGADFGLEEPKVGDFAGVEEEFLIRDFVAGAFLHALRGHTEGFGDGAASWHGHAGGFHPDVVGTGGAGFDAEALAGGAESGVDSSSEGDGVVWAGAFEFADGTVRPTAELVEDAGAERAGIEHAAVEENGVGDQERGTVDFCGASDGFEKLGGRGDVSFGAGEEAGEVLRDGGVCGVGKAVTSGRNPSRTI
jgi:hypothetical protein